MDQPCNQLHCSNHTDCYSVAVATSYNSTHQLASYVYGVVAYAAMISFNKAVCTTIIAT